MTAAAAGHSGGGGQASFGVRDGERTTVGALMAGEPLAPLPAGAVSRGPGGQAGGVGAGAGGLARELLLRPARPRRAEGDRPAPARRGGDRRGHAAGTVLARHRREPDHAGAVVRDEGHVTALEKKVLAARGQARAAVQPEGAAPAVSGGGWPRPPRSAARPGRPRRPPTSPRGRRPPGR